MSRCSNCRSCRDQNHADGEIAATTGLPVIALAGNPNTGKTTLFNRLTGLHQHTGNWPGKTVTRAEGVTTIAGRAYRVIDLPGTYTLLAASAEEQIARDYLVFGRPDAVVVVVDATALIRHLGLALQVLEITSRVVLCVNLIDEAARQGLFIDTSRLGCLLGVPAVSTSARSGAGVPDLLRAVAAIAQGRIRPQPHLPQYDRDIEERASRLTATIRDAVGDAVSPRWLALRLLEGDATVLEALAAHLDPACLTKLLPLLEERR
jgi:Fe2+ transport system protein B